MKDLVPGLKYRFHFADGTSQVLILEGFGSYMKPIWRVVETGVVIHTLPPYQTYEPEV